MRTFYPVLIVLNVFKGMETWFGTKVRVGLKLRLEAVSESPHISVYVCFPQAEGILRAWATPALQKDYGSDPVVTKIWNTTMTEVEYLDILHQLFSTCSCSEFKGMSWFCRS